MGFSQKQTVFILYAISGVLGITAVLLAEYGSLRALILLITVLVFILVQGFAHKNPLAEEEHDEEEKD